MRVRKHGKNKLYKVTCDNCDSDIEFSKSETYTYNNYIRQFGTQNKICGVDTWVCINCPVCGKKIIVDSEGIQSINN